MVYETIVVETGFGGRVIDITLGPPPGNIVTGRMMDEIADALAHARGGALSAVVFRGQGAHFSYGASVEEHRPGTIEPVLPRFHRLLEAVIACDATTIAQVGGLCLGGGFELVLSCALAFADETAQFGLPEIDLGVFPPAASVLLPLKTGEAAALETILTGARVGADEMRRLGVVSRVVAAGTLQSAVTSFIEKELLPKSALSLRFALRAARARMLSAYRAGIDEVERLYLNELMRTADAVEGVEAFLAKRPPEWKHA